VEPLSQRQGHQLELARSAANDAIRAVAMQRRRIKQDAEQDDAFFEHESVRQEVDVAFLLLALRWLREACQLVAELTCDEALAQAVGEFDRRLPGARDLRDVREHIRDYIQGSGRLQAATTTPDRLVSVGSLGSRTWLGRDDVSHFIWAGQEIRLDDVLPASERLYEAMRAAIAPFVVRDSGERDAGIRVKVGPESTPEKSSTGSI
jgi:hypothetical protein